MLAGTLARGKRYNGRTPSFTTPTMSHANTISSQSITAIILAGGASSRMGSNKALLQWQERPFIAHIIECLTAQVDYIAINTNSPVEFEQFGIPLIADTIAERCGPLAGIMAALGYSASVLTLIVPCDNPLLSPQLVARLFAALETEQTELAYACGGGDNHYLYALIRTSLRDNLAEFLRTEDYAVRHWYATLRVSQVDFSDQPEHFRNINSAEELARLNSR